MFHRLYCVLFQMFYTGRSLQPQLGYLYIFQQPIINVKVVIIIMVVIVILWKLSHESFIILSLYNYKPSQKQRRRSLLYIPSIVYIVSQLYFITAIFSCDFITAIFSYNFIVQICVFLFQINNLSFSIRLL